MVNDFEDKDEDGVKYAFKVAYNATKANKDVHKRFQEFAEAETDGGYLMAIKKLLDYWDGDWKMDALYKKICENEERINLFEKEYSNRQEKQPKSVKTFGGDENNG